MYVNLGSCWGEVMLWGLEEEEADEAGPALVPPSIVTLTHEPKLKQLLNFYLNRKASRFLNRTDSVATNLLLQFKKQTSV